MAEWFAGEKPSGKTYVPDEPAMLPEEPSYGNMEGAGRPLPLPPLRARRAAPVRRGSCLRRYSCAPLGMAELEL